MNDLEVIWTAISGGGAASIAIVLLTKNWLEERIKNDIRHEYDIRLETFKGQTKADADKALERLKADLQIAATERSIQYSKIFETQAEAISEVYAKLVALRNAFEVYVAFVGMVSLPSDEDRNRIFSAVYYDFKTYFEARRLFFGAQAAIQIQGFIEELHKIAYAMPIKGAEKSQFVERFQRFEDALYYVRETIPTLLGNLEREFRRNLGVQ